jgi:hypothetical protein
LGVWWGTRGVKGKEDEVGKEKRMKGGMGGGEKEGERG